MKEFEYVIQYVKTDGTRESFVLRPEESLLANINNLKNKNNVIRIDVYKHETTYISSIQWEKS